MSHHPPVTLFPDPTIPPAVPLLPDPTAGYFMNNIQPLAPIPYPTARVRHKSSTTPVALLRNPTARVTLKNPPVTPQTDPTARVLRNKPFTSVPAP